MQPNFNDFAKGLGVDLNSTQPKTPKFSETLQSIYDSSNEQQNDPNVFDLGGSVKNAVSNTVKSVKELPSKLGEDIQAGAQDIQQGNILKGVAKSGLRTAGDVAGVGMNAIGNALSVPLGAAAKIASNIAPETTQTVSDTVSKGKDIVSNWLSNSPFLQKFAMEHPNAEEDFSRLSNLIAAGLTSKDVGDVSPKAIIEKGTELAKSAVQGAKDVGQYASDVASNAKSAITDIGSKTPEEANQAIIEKYQKAVKPSVTSAKNPNYNDNVISAVNSIVENKPNMEILDKNGEITGKSPQSLHEFKQAIEQTKKSIFDQYDALQKAAGGSGATVELKQASDALREIQNNKTIIDLHPEIAKYAETRADALESRGTYTTQEAQDAIKTLNNSLEAFYKNPSYDTASKATVDSVIANNIRSGLDSTIENSQGPGYQELKNKYGSLKSIEKDVTNRSIVDARKNGKGLLDFTDIATGAEAIKGLLSFNPVEMATAGGMRAIKEYIKYVNDPNVGVKNLFKIAENVKR